MKNFIKTCGIVLCTMLMVFGLYYTNNTPKVYAESVENEFVQLGLDELAGGYQKDSVTRTSSAGEGFTYSVAKYGSFGFSGPFENVEIVSIINFSEITSGTYTCFALRSQGDSIARVENSAWTNKGYWFRWYAHGQFDFYINDTAVYSSKWGPMAAPAVETDYKVSFKTVNCYDAETETSTCKILIKINEYVFVDYTTDSEPLAAGWYAISSGGTAFTATGDKFAYEAINLTDVSSPIASANFSAGNIASNGVVTTTTGSYSGAGYAFQIDSDYAIKTQFKPTETKTSGSSLKITVGAKKTNAAAMNRFNTISEQWGWADSGYTVSWSAGGNGIIYRNATAIHESSSLPIYELGKTYNLVAGYNHYADGSNLVYLVIDDVLALSFLDIKTTTNTPLVPTTTGAPAAFTTYSLIVAYTCAAEITPYTNVTYNTDTLISKDLGNPTITTGTVVDANGQIESFNGGIVGKYNMSEKSSSIKFNANFTTTGSNIVFQMRAVGTLDTPWGGGWTNRGYVIYLHSSGQITFARNMATVYEGWATGGFSLPASTDTIIEVGTINISSNIVRFFVYVGDSLVINFVDTSTLCNEIGSFSVYSTGYVGSLTQVGYSIPTLSTNAIGNSAKVNDEIILSYEIDNKSTEDEVVYYVDEINSTATAKITADTLVPLTEGSLIIGVKVNDLYSSTILLTIDEAVKAIITNLPTMPVVVGGQKVTVDCKLSDDSEIISKEFSVENVTGRATIDATTGEITAIAAGSVNIFVTINGIKSQAYLITITPIIEIGNTLAMAVGQEKDLSYSSNCDLPDETIIVTYELISGDEYVDLNTETGHVEAIAIGMFTVRATLIGQTFSAVSEVATIPIEAPTVILLGVKDIIVSETIELSPSINDGITINTCSIVATTGGEHISIQGNTIKGKSAGRVWIKAIINGFESLEQEFAVEELVATIIAPNIIPVGESVDMSVMFNTNTYTPGVVTYEIVSGNQYATLTGNTLTALNKHSPEDGVKIKATIDGEYTATIKITIVKISPVGVSNNQTVYIGSTINLSYRYYGEDPVVSVEYKLIEGSNHAKLTTLALKPGETAADTKASLEIKSKGTIKIQIVVNGNVKETITLTAKKQTITNKSLITLIVVISVSAGLVAIAVPTTIVLVKKYRKRKGNTDGGKAPDNKKPSKKESKKEKDKTENEVVDNNKTTSKKDSTSTKSKKEKDSAVEHKKSSKTSENKTEKKDLEDTSKTEQNKQKERKNNKNTDKKG